MMKSLRFAIVLFLTGIVGANLNAQNASFEHTIERVINSTVDASLIRAGQETSHPNLMFPNETATSTIRPASKQSRSQFVFQLDSIVRNFGTEVFTYDGDGRVNQARYYQVINESEPAKLYLIIEYSYPSDTEIEVVRSTVINGTTSLSSKEWSTYNANGQQVEYVYSLWQDNTWVPDFRFVFVYEDELQILNNMFSWSDEGEWELSYYQIYEYNAAGQQTLREGFGILEGQEEFTLTFRESSSYDGDGMLIGQIAEGWNAEAQQLINSFKSEFAYDYNNVVRTGLFYSWDTSAEEPYWRPTSRIETLFDTFDNGNELTIELESWDQDSEEYILASGWTYFYDMNYTHDQLAMPTFISANKRLYEDVFYFVNGEMIVETMATYHYSDFILSSSALSALNHELYPFPNPSNDMVSFSGMEHFSTVELHNIQGRLIKHEQLGPGQQLSVADLSPGIYVYTIQHGADRHQGKLIRR